MRALPAITPWGNRDEQALVYDPTLAANEVLARGARRDGGASGYWIFSRRQAEAQTSIALRLTLAGAGLLAAAMVAGIASLVILNAVIAGLIAVHSGEVQLLAH